MELWAELTTSFPTAEIYDPREPLLLLLLLVVVVVVVVVVVD
jgi:hypothetical protein